MKRGLAIFATIAFVGALGTAAMAQQNNDITQGEIANFNQFLDNHPNLAQQLAADPSLINNPAFISNHQALHGFFQDHPASARRSTRRRANSCIAKDTTNGSTAAVRWLPVMECQLVRSPDSTMVIWMSI